MFTVLSAMKTRSLYLFTQGSSIVKTYTTTAREPSIYFSLNFSFDIKRRNYSTYIFGLTVKFGLTVRPYGKQNLAFRFSIIRPSGFGLTAPPLFKCSLTIGMKPTTSK